MIFKGSELTPVFESDFDRIYSKRHPTIPFARKQCSKEEATISYSDSKLYRKHFNPNPRTYLTELGW